MPRNRLTDVQFEIMTEIRARAGRPKSRKRLAETLRNMEAKRLIERVREHNAIGVLIETDAHRLTDVGLEMYASDAAQRLTRRQEKLEDMRPLAEIQRDLTDLRLHLRGHPHSGEKARGVVDGLKEWIAEVWHA